jgi:hypothetical protein
VRGNPVPRSRDRRRRISPELLGESDEEAFRPTDVAEPIDLFVLDHRTADKLHAVLAESGEHLVYVVHLHPRAASARVFGV